MTGRSTYFLSLAPGAWKTLATDDDSFWCCTGTAMEDFAKLTDTIYARDHDGLFVNLFISVPVHWAERGVVLRQSTRFPDEPVTRIEIEESARDPWSLRLRIPIGRRAKPTSCLTVRRSKSARNLAAMLIFAGCGAAAIGSKCASTCLCEQSRCQTILRCRLLWWAPLCLRASSRPRPCTRSAVEPAGPADASSPRDQGPRDHRRWPPSHRTSKDDRPACLHPHDRCRRD